MVTHITQNVKYNYVALLLGYNQVFVHPEAFDFILIYFSNILSISGKPHLFSWERLEIVNFPFLDGDVPRSPSYGVYISQLISFASVCSNVDIFNNRNLFLTAKLLKQGYRYHKIRKVFSKFYHRHSELFVKYNIGLKTLLQQGISEPIFYGDLVYKFKRIVGKPNFGD